MGGPLPVKDTSGALLAAVLAAVIGGYVVTSIVSQRASAEVDVLADSIVGVVSPAIESLASMRGSILEVELALSLYLQSEAPRRAARRDAVDAAMARLDGDFQRYLSLPILKGERDHWRRMRSSLMSFENGVERILGLAVDGKLAVAQDEFARTLEPAASRLITAAMLAIEFNAQDSRAAAEGIKDARQRSIWVANSLTILCGALGLVGAFLIRRQARRHNALALAHSSFHEARADELEQFAGRVAHDIRNPLSSAKMAAELGRRRADADETRDFFGRILRSLSRAEAITGALLDFARSGARPDPGARTSPREVLADVATGMIPEAEQLGIELRIDDVRPVVVACSAGVYLSLVGNLVRNAIKYMGESSVRRINVRVVAQGNVVRTEVSDTGPGIQAALVPTLFDAYFRGANAGTKDGLGLGLATVKRLAEGHGGSVGASSEPGKGSTFWFVLPRAGWAVTRSDDELRNSGLETHH